MKTWREEHHCTYNEHLQQISLPYPCHGLQAVSGWNAVETHLQAAEALGVPSHSSEKFQQQIKP